MTVLMCPHVVSDTNIAGTIYGCDLDASAPPYLGGFCCCHHSWMGFVAATIRGWTLLLPHLTVVLK